jgi:CBS domain-containing protein
MTRNVVCVTRHDTIDAAHQIMTEWEIRHLPVLDGRRVVGILSDRDVLLHASPGPDGLVVTCLPVGEVMTPYPLTCGEASSIATIAATMLRHKIDCLPIVDEQGELLGLVTSSDLLELVATAGDSGGMRAVPFRFEIHMCARPSAAGVFGKFGSRSPAKRA